MQVIEEITKRTLNGEEITYMIKCGTDPKAIVLISEVEGEIFVDSTEAKNSLIERATASITRLVDSAVQKAHEWYPNSFESPLNRPQLNSTKQSIIDMVTPPPQLNQNTSLDVTHDTVTLPDGTKVKVPKGFISDAPGEL